MSPKPSHPQTAELFCLRLDVQIYMKPPLIRLAALIRWSEIERISAVSFTSGRGPLVLAIRLVAEPLNLQHTVDASIDAVVNTWRENPFWHFFCDESCLQSALPFDPSSLTRWRKRLGEAGVKTLLAASVDAARRGRVIQKASARQVIIEPTVMPNAIAHPAGSRLLEKIAQHLVDLAEYHGPRQNYNRLVPRLAALNERYAHAKQFKRLKKAVRKLRTRVGRVHCEVQRQLHMLPEAAKSKVPALLQRSGRILTQRAKDRHKLNTLHIPEMEYIGKGTARSRYEFGVKVSLSTRLKEGLAVGCDPCRAIPTTTTPGPRRWNRWASSSVRTVRRSWPSWAKSTGAWKSKTFASCARGCGVASSGRSRP